MADDDKDTGKPDDILEEAQEAFKLAVEHENDNRLAAIEDLRFGRLGEQWPERVAKDRETEGRPCLTFNRMPAFIRQVVNDARQNKPSIKCHPADSKADPATALIMNGLIRNIEYASSADVAYDTAAEYAISGGFGYWRVSLKHLNERSFDLDITIDAIPDPLTVYGDPHSTAADSADWNSAFVTELMPKETFETKYKGAEEVDWKADYADVKPPWMEGEKVLTAEWWKREEKPAKLLMLSDGSVMLEEDYKPQKDIFDAFGITVTKERATTTSKVIQYILTGAEVLETNEWVGKFIPIVPVYGEDVSVEGKRYLRSLIRDAKDAQRNFNYWRTTTTELVALAPRAPYVGRKGAFKSDIGKWNTANNVNHPFMEYDGPEAPQRQRFEGPPAGALQEALNAADDMKSVMGLYDASLGARSNETSGKAIMARQREGDVSTFHFIDNVRRSIRHTGRILLDLIPKVYTGERIIRVLGEDGKSPTNVQLGKLEQQPAPQPQGQPGQAGQEGQPDPAVQRIYDLGLGQYDLTVETGPSFTTQREESSNMIIEMVRAYPAAAPLVMDILAKNQDWPGADEISQRMQAMLPPQIKGQDPRMAQMGQQMQAMQAENASLKADKSLEGAKVRIDSYNAETNRIKALGGTPEQLQALIMQVVQQAMGTSLPGVQPGPMPPGMMPMNGGGAPVQPQQPANMGGGMGGVPPGGASVGMGGPMLAQPQPGTPMMPNGPMRPPGM